MKAGSFLKKKPQNTYRPRHKKMVQRGNLKLSGKYMGIAGGKRNVSSGKLHTDDRNGHCYSHHGRFVLRNNLHFLLPQ